MVKSCWDDRNSLDNWYDLQDTTLEDLADASGTEFEIPAGFDEQVYVKADWFVTIPEIYRS